MHAGVGSRHTHNNLTYTFWTSYLMCLNGCGLDDFSHALKRLLSCIPVAMLTAALLCKDVARPCSQAAAPPSGGEAKPGTQVAGIKAMAKTTSKRGDAVFHTRSSLQLLLTTISRTKIGAFNYVSTI